MFCKRKLKVNTGSEILEIFALGLQHSTFNITSRQQTADSRQETGSSRRRREKRMMDDGIKYKIPYKIKKK
jgi:hypothetical protein